LIVFDASALVYAFVSDEWIGDRVRALLSETDEVAIPEFAVLEMLSVLRKWWLAGELDARRFAIAVGQIANMPIPRYSAVELSPRIFELRNNITPYDATYVALAERLGYTLVTEDARLARAPGPGCRIELIAESD
jgi:predicted nucleic acid-binding protein